MGINNRDYIREDQPGYGGGGSYGSTAPWPVWQKLIFLTMLVFVGQILIPQVTQWFYLSSEAVLHGQVWRLLTYAFLHDPGSLFHILFNMLVVYFFGRRIESMYGGKEFTLFYCTSAIFAGLCFILWSLFLRDTSPALGASGAVVAIVILYALHFPREKVYLWGLIAVEMRWLAGFIVIVDLYPVLVQLGGNNPGGNVAHMAHLGGGLFAYIYYSNRIRLSNWTGSFSGLKTNPLRGKSNLKIYREDDNTNLDVEVDRILQKINEQGESSLTKKERKILTQASEKYKNRQL